MKSKRLIEMGIDAIKGLLDIGLIPVLYGVPAYDVDRGCSILSGDDIAAYLAIKLEAERIIFGTNVGGVFTANPNNPRAKLIDLVNRRNFKDVIEILLKSSSDSDATGGMLRKVFRAGEASVHGVESIIVNASAPEMLRKALEKEKTGTIVEGISENSLNSVRRRLRYTGIDL